MESIGLIVNENAGNRSGGKLLGSIISELHNQQIEYRLLKTTHRGHAIELSKKLIKEGFRKIVGVGGDGTLNEIVNSVFIQAIPPTEFTVGMIPVGTGNDWCRSTKVDTNIVKSIALIKENRTIIQDIGKVYSINHPNAPIFFANSVGGGFDAFVAHKTNLVKQKGKGSPYTYLLVLLASLFQFKPTHMTIEADGKRIEDSVLSFTAGIGKYNGNGMMQLPHADVRKGIMDLVIIRNLPKWKIIRNVSKLYDGSHIHMDEVNYLYANSITIHSEPPILIETDGEDFGHSPIKIELLPKALRVYSGLDGE